jgi:hypothetical protein
LKFLANDSFIVIGARYLHNSLMQLIIEFMSNSANFCCDSKKLFKYFQNGLIGCLVLFFYGSACICLWFDDTISSIKVVQEFQNAEHHRFLFD